MNLIVIPMLLAIFGFIFLIPILIGVYVYKDAKSRNMDAILWTIVALFVPGFIGLILYLVFRNTNNYNTKCPQCTNVISQDYLVCPFCGKDLKEACKNCKEPIEHEWKVCPKCGENIAHEEKKAEATPYIKKTDRTLGLIVASVLIIPILILLAVMIGMVNFTSVGSYSTSHGTHINKEDEPSYVNEWIERCDKKGYGVYILDVTNVGERKGIISDDERENYRIYLYLNEYNKESQKMIINQNFNIKSNNNLEIRLHTGENMNKGKPEELAEEIYDYELSSYFVHGKKVKNVTVYIDDKKVKNVFIEKLKNNELLYK